MRKILFLIMMMVVTITAISQRSIKGYELGEKYKVDDYKETTVFGRKALVDHISLYDGRAYIIFATFEDDKKSDMLYIKNKMESSFGITLFKNDLEDDEYNIDIYRYEAVRGGIKYILVVMENTTFDTFQYALMIADIKLLEIHNKEIDNDI